MRKLVKNVLCHLVLLVLFCVLWGCGEDKHQPGIVATVNGEPITLHDVQILMDSRYASLGMPAEAAFEGMRESALL